MKLLHYGMSLLFLQLCILGSAECGRILVWHTEGSHWINLKTVLETLTDRGHEVTVLVQNASIFLAPSGPSRFTHEFFNVSISLEEVYEVMDKFLYFSLYELDRLSYLEINFKLYRLIQEDLRMQIQICNGLLRNEPLIEKLKGRRFDVLLADPIFACSELMAELLDVPLVYTLRFSIANTLERLCGQLPAPPSFVPAALGKFTDQMCFTDRLKNMLLYLSQDLMSMKLWEEYDKYYTEILGRPTTFCETVGKAEIWLIRTYWDFEYPRPFLPNFKFVGGLHCKPAKPLPEDMEELVLSSGDDGIVIFTLGSMIKNLTMEKTNIIAHALGQIPQKILWRYSGEKPETLAPNTILYDWIPQNDLLGHPKTKAFITHGGTNGIYEAIYHGVPMVGIPLFADQPDNMVHMKAKGAAVILDYNTMQSEDIVNGLKTVINDPSYKENAMRLSRIYHDRPMAPRDEAMFWIEFVMRNKGAKHLRVQAHNLTWYQYHCLDVFATLAAIVALIIFIFVKTCSFCIRKCFYRSKAKSKSD
ncbi:hypothetical protein AGOR_G00047250 [Albula goreensis]|uniref:UDP-glucuronosyltransferase n=1 Tax=Albula goreensis TaxID=1534307 RepID=A0A8T3DUX4_9TELE|nr:hypothetical protein AGOR_G00047250 [Albula goreensis]